MLLPPVSFGGRRRFSSWTHTEIGSALLSTKPGGQEFFRSIDSKWDEKLGLMCRSIKVLRRPEEPATKDELTGAALQYVRKISGMRKPSQANQEAFERAVVEITNSSGRLLDALRSPPKRSQSPKSVQVADEGEIRADPS